MVTYTKTLNNGYRLELTATVLSQSVANNESVLDIVLKLIQGGTLQANSSFNNPYSSSVSGTSRSGTKQYNFFNYNSLTLDHYQRTVGHNSDGSKTVSLSGSFTDLASQNYVGDGTASGNFTLPTIPRSSKATVTSPVDAGSSMTINTNRASSGFTHKVEWTFGSLSGVIAASGVGTSTTWTPPLSLLAQIPNQVSGTGNIKLTTYSGSTQIGSPTYTQFTLRAPASVVPTVGSITHSEGTPGVAANVGAYVQRITKLTVGVSGSAGIYGSTIKSTKIEVGGQTINAASGTTPGTLVNSGTVPLKVTVTDSRGRTAVSTVNITVLAYAAPKINAFSVQRANSAGTPDENGTYLRVNINAAISSLIVGGTQQNQMRRIVSTAPQGSGYTSKSNVLVPLGTTTFNSFVTIGTYLSSIAYDVRLQIQDDFNTTTFIVSIPTAKIAMHWDGNIGVGIGKYREKGVLDVGGDIFMNGIKVRTEEPHPYVDSIRTTTALIPNNTWTAVNIAVSDQLLAFAGVSLSGTTVTIQKSGIYTLSAAVKWTGNGGGNSRALGFLISSYSASQIAENNLRVSPMYPATIPVSTSWTGRLAAGTTVQLAVVQNSGESLTLDQIEFGLAYIGPYA